MKTMTGWSRGLFISFSIIVCIVFTGSQLTAGPQFPSNIIKNLKILKSRPKHFLQEPAVRVKVPLKIMGLHRLWRGSELVVEVLVFFRNSNNFTGIGSGKATRAQVLSTGSYDGTVLVSVNEVNGFTAGEATIISIALAKRGNECKILGFGCSEPCGNIGLEDTVLPYSYPMLRTLLEGQGPIMR